MRKFLVFLSVATSGFALMDPSYGDDKTAGRYQVVFSKDDKLCKYARDILNEDIRRNGFVGRPSTSITMVIKKP
jgi:hypothetical protein